MPFKQISDLKPEMVYTILSTQNVGNTTFLELDDCWVELPHTKRFFNRKHKFIEFICMTNDFPFFIFHEPLKNGCLCFGQCPMCACADKDILTNCACYSSIRVCLCPPPCKLCVTKCVCYAGAKLNWRGTFIRDYYNFKIALLQKHLEDDSANLKKHI